MEQELIDILDNLSKSGKYEFTNGSIECRPTYKIDDREETDEIDHFRTTIMFTYRNETDVPDTASNK